MNPAGINLPNVDCTDTLSSQFVYMHANGIHVYVVFECALTILPTLNQVMLHMASQSRIQPMGGSSIVAVCVHVDIDTIWGMHMYNHRRLWERSIRFSPFCQ